MEAGLAQKQNVMSKYNLFSLDEPEADPDLPVNCPKEYNESVCNNCFYIEGRSVAHPGGDGRQVVNSYACELGHWEDNF